MSPIADDVTVDNGALPDYIVSSDEDGDGAAIQRTKLAYSADGSKTHVQADIDGLLVNLGVNNDVTVTGTVAATGPLTDTQLRSTAVPVSGTVTASGPLTDTQLRASAVPVSVATVGHGTAAAAVRVELPTDGTGVIATVGGITNVVHVDDNAGSLSVDDGAGSLTVDNAGTFAVQDSQVVADNAGFTDGTTKVQPAGFIFDEVAGTALSENDAAAARIDSKRAQVGVIEDATTRGQRASVSSGGALKVDGSAAIQPVSGTVAVTGSATVTGNKAEDAAAADGDAGLPILGVRNDSAAARTSTDGDYGMVALDSAGRVGISDLGGSISIDDNSSTISVDDGAGSLTVDLATVGHGTAAAAVRVELPTDGTGTLATVGTITSVVHVDDNAGSLTVDGSVAVSGTTSLTPGTGAANLGKAEDAAHASGDVGVMALGVRNDAGTTLAGTDGDYIPMSIDSNGALRVTGGGGGTEYTEDVASAADPVGKMTLARRRDTLTGAEVSTDGDNIAVNSTAKGELYVKQTDVVPINDNSGSLTVDAPVGTPVFVRLSDGSAPIATLPVSLATAPVLVAGAAVIGKVGIDQTTPGTSNLVALAANQSVNVAQINGVAATMGNGVAGTGVQRVTLASDSTGQVALAAGSAAIGKLTANSGVIIGDVNVVSDIPGTGATALGKAIDNAAGATDTGVGMLAVRRDLPTALTPAAGDWVAPTVSSMGQQWVLAGSRKRLQVASSGLTIVTTAYIAGDVMGADYAFTGYALASGGGGWIEQIKVYDKADVTGSLTVFLYRDDPTNLTDNAAFSLADADNLLLIGVFSIGMIDTGANRFGMWQGSVPYLLAATTLYAQVRTDSATAVFGAVGDLPIEIIATVDA